MEKTISSHAISVLKRLCFAMVFCYFGFIINPQWAPVPQPYFIEFHWYDPISPLLLIWLLMLPIVLVALVAVYFWGTIGLSRIKAGKLLPNPIYEFFVQISSKSFLWFAVCIALNLGANILYEHRRFDAEIWKNPQSAISPDRFHLSPRRRMVDDLTINILPESTFSEITNLLGPSERMDWKDTTLEPPDLIYYLGPDRMGGILPETLCIWFDESGNFTRYENIYCGW